MRIILFLGKCLSQRINNILISGHFLYLYIIPTNDLSNQIVYLEYIFRPLMRPWFLCLRYGSIVQYKGIKSIMLGTTPSLVMNFLSQIASLAASKATMYSDSVVESTVVSCLELFQLTAPPFNVNT